MNMLLLKFIEFMLIFLTQRENYIDKSVSGVPIYLKFFLNLQCNWSLNML